MSDASDPAAGFDPLRPQLMRVAYRMLGSVADAEDVVQEAFIRWMDTDRETVREPGAFLRRTVTRLCLDQLKSAHRRREVYVGPWLPEPVVEDEIDEDVTLPLLFALERLSPLERAAFLLHDVFDVGFDEVAETLGRDSAACRQLAKRARAHVRQARPRFRLERARALELAQAFFTASRSADPGAIGELGAMLAEDVGMYTDGGGKRPAAIRPLFGQERVLRLLGVLAGHYAQHGSTLVRVAFVNGLPGFITRESDGVLQTTALDIEDGRITTVYVVRNPDKLRHLN
jgi:RNA polymerase sigma-70 factor (ECF subfamily)